MTQDLFDSITNESSVASSSGSIAKQAVRRFSESWDFVPTNISMSPEIVDDKSKSPEISLDLPMNNEPKNSTEVSPQQISYPLGYQTREQREIRLRQKAIELGEDPEIFITITDKDKLDSIAFRDRMQTDARMCGFAKEAEEDPSEYMDMTVRERLISEEIIRRSLEEDGITSSWLDTDEEWKKTINILQENGGFFAPTN
ncbi:11607_t:CDS:2 [Paraglomus brasilianum]|uniref:11607_t:CDS:1 n=1 Tax=Paraglomus brasilianum TaxID=144538 RepID=A0A9N8WH80_9GLOM|nr:11607_t:CDS:2 [Paraglomus brasilianum]